MVRLMAIVLAVAGFSGFALGWLAYSSTNEAPASSVSNVSSRPASARRDRHRFPLSTADVKLDRETPAVAADDQDRVLIAWASQTGEHERTIWLARSGDGGVNFEEPRPWRKVATYEYASKMGGKETVRSTNVVPRLAAQGDRVYLAWTEAVDGGPLVRYYVSVTSDGGAMFSEPVAASGDDADRPAFTALRVGPDGLAACTWLDHRNKVQQPFCGLCRPQADAQEVLEQLVYPGPPEGGVCPCCDTDVLRGPDGSTFVAFRNNDENYRDICVARNWGDARDGFEPPVAVSAERWQFKGCPHDGPSLTLSHGKLHVVWMDAHTDKRRVYHASSDVAALNFVSHEIQPQIPGEQGHPKIAAGNGTLFAVWDASPAGETAPETQSNEGHSHSRLSGSGRVVMLARCADDGQDFSPGEALDPRPGAFQMNPTVAIGPKGTAYIVWNEITESGKSVGFARVPMHK
jgi:hypothetical protein